MNCNCGGTCANCQAAALGNAGAPQFGSGGVLPRPAPLTFEQFSAGIPASQPIMTNSASPMSPIPAPVSNIAPVTPDGTQNDNITPAPSDDEWVFVDMSPWKILFWSIEEPPTLPVT